MNFLVNSVIIQLLLLASSAWADDPQQIVTSSIVNGPLGCPMKSSSSPINVRFNTLKTSRGLVFYRRTLSEDLFVCFAEGGSQTLAATNIKQCAEATEAAGLQMFSWENNACTGYVNGIPKDLTCRTNEAVVLYSVEDGVINGPEDITLTLHQSVSSIWAEWAKCHPDYPSNAAKFVLTWNGDTIPLDRTTFEYRLQDPAFCTDDLTQVAAGLKAVTLAVLDASDNPLMAPITETLEATPVTGSRFLLNNGNCFYHDHSTLVDYPGATDFCSNTLYGELFIEYQDGDFEDYADALTALTDANATLKAAIDEYYIGLLYTAENERTWLSGISENITLATEDPNSIFSFSIGSDECSVVEKISQIDDRDCDEDIDQSCHEYLP